MHVAFLLQWPRVARGQAAVFHDAHIICQSSDPNNDKDHTSNTTATNASDTYEILYPSIVCKILTTK